jgi:hypothetical protein
LKVQKAEERLCDRLVVERLSRGDRESEYLASLTKVENLRAGENVDETHDRIKNYLQQCRKEDFNNMDASLKIIPLLEKDIKQPKLDVGF